MSQFDKYQEKSLISNWDKVAEGYNQPDYWSRPETHAWLEVLIRHIGEPSGKRIIEVGCGSGFMSIALAKRGAICGLLDISPVAMKRALAIFRQSGLAEPEYYIQDALNSKVPSESYDIVWNAGVIEHFYDQGKTQLIKEMWRMAKAGGKVIIMVPNSLCWQARLGQIWQQWRKTWQYGFQDNMSPRRLSYTCKKIGLKVNNVYAFDPVIGWRWIPIIGAQINKWMGPKSRRNHLKHSWRGYMSVLVVHK